MTKEYQQRIRKCYKAAFEYLEKYAGAVTLDNFTAAYGEMDALSRSGDPLLQALLLANYEELARESQTGGLTSNEI